MPSLKREKTRIRAKPGEEKTVYTVYLIDDEKWALYDVQHTCPFADYGFSVAGAQTNPFTALDEVLALRPSAVFVDVRMPQISGIDLIRMILESAPETAFVILSGYAEFEYAASALRLGVVDYCLKPMDAQRARALLARLRDHLESRAPAAPQSAPEIACSSEPFNALLRHVNAHINEPLVLGELAQRFFLNASYCGELFKTVTGETFTHYVRRRRLEQACDLLAHTSLSLSQIAARVGYADLPYFSRVFAASYGVSPSRWRAAEKAQGRKAP